MTHKRVTQALPDPLALWMKTSGLPSDTVLADTLAASLIALWRNQEELVRELAAAFGQTQWAELAVELMLHPLRRQAELVALTAAPNPQQAAVLGAALSAWLMAQVGIAQLAASDLQGADDQSGDQRPVGVCWLQKWVEAFAQRQVDYLGSVDGQRRFAALSQAWAGLDVADNVPLSTAGHQFARLRSSFAAPDKPTLIVVAHPLCPVASLVGLDTGLMHGLARSFDLQVLDWGDLRGVGSLPELGGRLMQALEPTVTQASVTQDRSILLDLSGLGLLPADLNVAVHRLPLLSLGVERLRTLLAAVSIQELGLQRDYLPAELFAVLCDALYPDWAVSACLQGGAENDTALRVRRALLGAMPALSGELLAALCRIEQSVSCDGATVASMSAELTLLQLLNGQGVAGLSEQLLALS